MSVIRFNFDIKQLVTYHEGPANTGRLVGAIVAREVYETASGRTNFYYVRWILPEGGVSRELERFHEWELIAHE